MCIAGASPWSPLDMVPLPMVGKGDHSPSKMRMDFQGQSTQFQCTRTPAVDWSASAIRPWLNTDIIDMKLDSLKSSAPAPPVCVQLSPHTGDGSFPLAFVNWLLFRRLINASSEKGACQSAWSVGMTVWSVQPGWELGKVLWPGNSSDAIYNISEFLMSGVSGLFCLQENITKQKWLLRKANALPQGCRSWCCHCCQQDYKQGLQQLFPVTRWLKHFTGVLEITWTFWQGAHCSRCLKNQFVVSTSGVLHVTQMLVLIIWTLIWTWSVTTANYRQKTTGKKLLFL